MFKNKKNILTGDKRSISEDYFNWPVSHSNKTRKEKSFDIIKKIKEYLTSTGEKL